MQGTVEGGAHVPSATPSADEGYDLFISKEFVQNTLDYYMKSELWKHLIVNRTSPRTAAWFNFRHRLVDYEDIVPSVLKQYPSYYLVDTELNC